MMSPSRTPHGHLAPYKYTVSRTSISTPNLLLSIPSTSSHPLPFELATTVAQLHAGEPQADADAAADWSPPRRRHCYQEDRRLRQRRCAPRRRPPELRRPLRPPTAAVPASPRVDDDDDPPPHDLPLILRPASSRTDSGE
jgi:hypothetical protein